MNDAPVKVSGYKLVYDHYPMVKPKWLKALSDHHNRLHDGLITPITEHDARHIRNFMPSFIEYRQLCHSSYPVPEPIPKDYWQLHLEWYSDCILIEASNGKWDLVDHKVIYEPNLYFRLGCEHKNRKSTNIGKCLHRYDCPDCGHSYEIDSSD